MDSSAPQSPSSDTSSTSTILVGCAVGCFGLIGIAVLSVALGWGSFVRWGISTDLDNYLTTIEVATTNCQNHQELIDLAFDLRDRHDREELSFTMTQWVTLDSAVVEIISDDVISDDECNPLMRRLQDIERTGRTD